MLFLTAIGLALLISLVTGPRLSSSAVSSVERAMYMSTRTALGTRESGRIVLAGNRLQTA